MQFLASGEIFVFGWLPLLAAVGMGYLSVRCLLETPSLWQGIFTAAVVPVLGTAALMLFQMVMQPMTWPTLLPHLMIVLAVPVVVIQLVLVVRHAENGSKQ